MGIMMVGVTSVSMASNKRTDSKSPFYGCMQQDFLEAWNRDEYSNFM